MLRTLNLSIDTFQVILGEFGATGYDLNFAPSGDVEYSLFGCVVDGPAYEEKRIWTISAFCTLAEWLAIQRIYKRSEYKRRQAPTDFSIYCDDYIRPFVEDGNTRSRALAPGAMPITDAGGIRYAARYRVRLMEPKAVEQGGRKPYLVSFVLKELDRVGP